MVEVNENWKDTTEKIVRQVKTNLSYFYLIDLRRFSVNSLDFYFVLIFDSELGVRGAGTAGAVELS